MLEFLLENRTEIQRIASVVLALAMWRWGSVPERLIASAFIGIFVVPLFVAFAILDGSVLFGGGRYLTISIDAVAMVCFIGIALYANRNYTLWIAGFQLVAVAAHLVGGATDVISPIAYAILVIGPSYLQILAMLIGLIDHTRRKKRFGEYRDWRVPINLPFVSSPGVADGPKVNA